MNLEGLRALEASVKGQQAKPAPTVYLTETPFSDRRYYSVEVKSDGVTIYSECCGDTMSPETARLVHEAIGRYLADLDAQGPEDLLMPTLPSP